MSEPNDLDYFHDPKKPPYSGPYQSLDDYLAKMKELESLGVASSMQALEGDITPTKPLEGKKNTGIISEGELSKLTRKSLGDLFPDK